MKKSRKNYAYVDYFSKVGGTIGGWYVWINIPEIIIYCYIQKDGTVTRSMKISDNPLTHGYMRTREEARQVARSASL